MKSFIDRQGKRRRISPRLPAFAIRTLVGMQHVGMADDALERLILDRIGSQPGWTASLRRQAVEYALSVHRQDRAIYAWTKGGARL